MSANHSMQVFMREGKSTLSNLCTRSSALISCISEIVEKLKNGGDINVMSNSSHVLTLTDKIRSVLNHSEDELNVSRDDVQACMETFPWIFTLPIQIYFIAGCKTILMPETMDSVPAAPQIQQLITDLLRLHNTGFVSNIWMYLECFIDVIIMKLKKSKCITYKLDLCHLLQIIGSSPKSASMIISKLQTIFDSYYVYIQESNWHAVTDVESEILMLILNTIIVILEYNCGTKAMSDMQDYQKLCTTLQQLKKITRLRVFHADISYCLGLLPV